jgi:hypothetical protein
MVPGMTERERCAADAQRLAWLADATLGPTLPRTAAVGLPRSPEFETRTVYRRILALILSPRGFGSRLQPRAASRAIHSAMQPITT